MARKGNKYFLKSEKTSNIIKKRDKFLRMSKNLTQLNPVPLAPNKADSIKTRVGDTMQYNVISALSRLEEGYHLQTPEEFIYHFSNAWTHSRKSGAVQFLKNLKNQFELLDVAILGVPHQYDRTQFNSLEEVVRFNKSIKGNPHASEEMLASYELGGLYLVNKGVSLLAEQKGSLNFPEDKLKPLELVAFTGNIRKKDFRRDYLVQEIFNYVYVNDLQNFAEKSEMKTFVRTPEPRANSEPTIYFVTIGGYSNKFILQAHNVSLPNPVFLRGAYIPDEIDWEDAQKLVTTYLFHKAVLGKEKRKRLIKKEVKATRETIAEADLYYSMGRMHKDQGFFEFMRKMRYISPKMYIINGGRAFDVMKTRMHHQYFIP